MKGNPKILPVLYSLLADELTGINQYMVRSEICATLGNDELQMAIENKTLDKINYSDWLIGRIIFFGGTPDSTKPNPIKISQSVSEMMRNERDSERDNVRNHVGPMKITPAVKNRDTGSSARHFEK